MAKFKVGDKVRVKFGNYDFTGTVYGEPTKDSFGTVYPVKTDAGRLFEEVDERTMVKNACGVVSKNAVVNAALNATACNADVKKALNGKIVCNGIGDCFADAVFDLEKAVKMAGKAGAKSLIKEAKDDVAYVTSYDWADTKDKQYMKKCLSAIDKALSNPTEEAITAARWECEKARAYADGGSPSRAFWNSDSCNEVAKNELSGLTPEQNKMNAESKNLRLAARSNLMRCVELQEKIIGQMTKDDRWYGSASRQLSNLKSALEFLK